MNDKVKQVHFMLNVRPGRIRLSGAAEDLAFWQHLFANIGRTCLMLPVHMSLTGLTFRHPGHEISHLTFIQAVTCGHWQLTVNNIDPATTWISCKHAIAFPNPPVAFPCSHSSHLSPLWFFMLRVIGGQTQSSSAAPMSTPSLVSQKKKTFLARDKKRKSF